MSDLTNCAADIIFLPFDQLSRRDMLTIAFLLQPYHLIFSLRVPQSVTFSTIAPVINLPASILTPPRVFKYELSTSPASRPSPKFALAVLTSTNAT